MGSRGLIAASGVVFLVTAGTWLALLPSNIDRQDGSWTGRVLFFTAALSLIVLIVAVGIAIKRNSAKPS